MFIQMFFTNVVLGAAVLAVLQSGHSIPMLRVAAPGVASQRGVGVRAPRGRR